MIRTRDFFISSAAFTVFLILLLLLSLNEETSVQEASLPDVVIMAEPQDTYSVELEITENRSMRRAIFIEKIRNALPDIVLPKKVETPQAESIHQDTAVSPNVFEKQNITVPVSASTSIPNISRSSSTSISTTPSSTSTPEQLQSN